MSYLRDNVLCRRVLTSASLLTPVLAFQSWVQFCLSFSRISSCLVFTQDALLSRCRIEANHLIPAPDERFELSVVRHTEDCAGLRTRIYFVNATPVLSHQAS
jgi:hypothetical protein